MGLSQKYLKDSLKSPFSFSQAINSPEWVKDAIIYCVYLRSFSNEGTFEGLERRIPELKELGVNVIWLMPIHPIGIKYRKGKLGSPYSVRDYYDVNPEYGTIIDFQKLLGTVHKNKMKLIIDLVINHTSWDSKLLQQHPEWFTKDSIGNIISPNDDWTDVADLDYTKRGLRHYMLEMIEWWIKDINIDGFRCDVSELIPLDFWDEVRERLNHIKPVMLLSEGSLPEYHLKTFDITYSWNIYDALKPLLDGKRTARYIDTLLEQEWKIFPKNSLRLRFNTNHDKNYWDAPAIEKFGVSGLKLTAVLINTIPGIPLIYNGEEVANDKRLSLFEKIDIDWTKPREMDSLYKILFKLRRENKAISRGNFLKIPTTDDKNIYAFLRTESTNKVLVALNFSKESQVTKLNVPIEMLYNKKQTIKVKDIFSDDALTIDHNGKCEIKIAPHGFKIYVLEK